ncbi:GNAT family N-acetyltransferase [Novosphingobium sp. FSY-8]|uniref:GNAT family N-acetyltransferase n=2 Tax=Novosphingobium ovatum TaxID=1908523 RepID=A0ABW9XBG1_9SPHN|nr:GNAT family N-acetyltransferase [Novosphingobium ovatum]
MFAPAQDPLDQLMVVMAAAFDPIYGEAWTRSQVDHALLMGNCRYWLIAPDGTAPTPGGAAAGFALTRQVLDEAELLLFAIHPDHRRKGLGARLLQTVIHDQRESGIARFLLEMRAGNSAEHLYAAHGFTRIGIRPKYYRGTDGQRRDAVTFACDLT